MRSVYDAIRVLSAIRPVGASTPVGTPTAIAIDTFGYNSALFDVQVGTPTGTPTSFTIDARVDESTASGGTYTAVSGATITQVTAPNKSAQIRVEGLGTSRQRYLKLMITLSITGGTAPTVPVSGTVMLGRAYQEPVGNSGTPA